MLSGEEGAHSGERLRPNGDEGCGIDEKDVGDIEKKGSFIRRGEE